MRYSTNTLPIVMTAIDYDPLARGYVANLARPSGNITGIVFQQIELVTKRLQVVTEAFPELRARPYSGMRHRQTNGGSRKALPQRLDCDSSEASCASSPTITSKRSHRCRLITAVGSS